MFENHFHFSRADEMLCTKDVVWLNRECVCGVGGPGAVLKVSGCRVVILTICIIWCQSALHNSEKH